MTTTSSLTSEPAGLEIPPDDRPDLSKRRLLLPLSTQTAGADNRATADDEPEPRAPFLIVADYIRQCSVAGELVHDQCFLAPPYSLDAATIEELFDHMAASDECADILSISNGEERYYYSDQSMSHNYARILLFTHEQDACKTIADTVRFECQTYPRPYKVHMLTLPPYSFDQEKIDSALRFFSQSDSYKDIRTVVASNDEPYLFSERFMSYGKAKGLCEWIEVEQYENP